MAGFALQLILTAEALRVIVYEGALKSDTFEGLRKTFCLSVLTCCREVPNNVFSADGEIPTPQADLNNSQSGRKKGGNVSNLELSNTKVNKSSHRMLGDRD